MAIKAGPRETSMTVSLSRKIWTQNPNGSYEIAVSLTAEPDLDYSTTDNLNAIHLLLKQRLDEYLDADTTSAPTHIGGTRNGTHHPVFR